jgi:hypothetical protein
MLCDVVHTLLLLCLGCMALAQHHRVHLVLVVMMSRKAEACHTLLRPHHNVDILLRDLLLRMWLWLPCYRPTPTP